MAGTREGLELRAEYSWNTEPLYLMKCDGFWTEQGIPRQIPFGTELTDADGEVRELIAVDSIIYNEDELYLETKLSTTLAPTADDLVFNRLGVIRGGKQQGHYVADFAVTGNTATITYPVPPLAEPFVPGDKIVVHGSFEEFEVLSVSGANDEVLTLVETVPATVTGVDISDASGTLMLLYVFSSDVAVVQNSSTIVRLTGFSFVG